MPPSFIPLILISIYLPVPVTALPIPRSIICYPTTWRDMVTFFVINYIAHAASIPTVAGATWYDTVFWTTISLFLPFAGLGKAMGLVLNYILVGKSDLEKAWACDALFVVARSSHWEPGDKPEEVYVKFPVDFRTLQDECTATIKVTRDGEGRDIKPHESLKIHGGIYLPPGYQIDYPDPYYLSEYFPFRSTINRRISLSKTQSWVKMTISVAQLVYSTTTIYRSRGSQLEKYGYAAFGLSVFPYAFMSLANFLCVGIVGEYPSVSILRTDVMYEAERRGGHFSGVVGCCKGELDGIVGGEGKPYVEWSDFTRTTISVESGGSSKEEEGDECFLEKILVVTVEGVTKRFLLLQDSDRGGDTDVDHVFQVSSYANQGSIPGGCYVFPRESLQGLPYNSVLLTTLALSLILPYLVIYTLTKFEARESTIEQRIWMMAWLSSSQLAILSFGWITTRMPHFSPSTWQDIYNDPCTRWYFALLFPSLFLLPIPAMGGFVIVGNMLAEFGTCALAPS